MHLTYRTRTTLKHLALVTLALFAFLAEQAMADRVKDLASVAGVRNNQLTGYGLVVGLNGTGDQTTQTPFTVQSIVNMLTQFGVTIPPGVSLQLKNVAAVTVHADLPPFAKPGQTIDVTVSSIGNAKSLRGGTLLMAPMRGADGNVYAIAQGNLVVGGFGASGNDGSKRDGQHSERRAHSERRHRRASRAERFPDQRSRRAESACAGLHDLEPACRTDQRDHGAGTAESLDAVSVRVRAPANASQRTAFVSALQNLEVTPGEVQARVIVNSRTGTVVIGDNVRVTPAAVSHGSLVVTISESPYVSQPPRRSAMPARRSPWRIRTSAFCRKRPACSCSKPGTSLDEIVRAVNRVGAAPGDLVAILEALKQAGALRAELIVI